MGFQNDMEIDNSTGANVRADINDALKSLANNSSGSSAPSTNYASQFFANTSSSMMQLNNTSGNAFINLFTLAGAPAFPLDGTINSINIGKGANSVAGNTVLGESALDASVTGGNNTAIGNSALTANTSGLRCTAVGSSALAANTTGSDLTAIGANALDDNTTGIRNTAVGFASLGSCVSNNRNTAMGYAALNLTTSDNNAAFGNAALAANETGTQNVAVGSFTLDACTTASSNTAVGYNSLGANTTGANNTAVGSSAGDGVTTGSSNVFIGNNVDTSEGDGDNRIVIGQGINGTSNNTFSFGKPSNIVSNTFTSNATFTRNSDVSLKKDIFTNEDCGLDFINDLRTVTFKWIDDSNHKEKMYGFIAQEVKAALDKHNITDFNGWTQEKEGDLQGISYEMFIMPLVKAVQELSAKVTALEAG